MSEPTAAVFLSYAREDSEAARRIAEALRAFGVEAWFDQNELRGGDSWDQKIRGQIRACTLFVPIISAQTQARAEGYFRREWKIAVERTHDMAAGVAFIVPVVIDDTRESEAAVPDEFMHVQWTRLERGVPTPAFVDQVKRLLEAPRKGAPATRPAFPHAVAPVPAPVARAASPAAAAKLPVGWAALGGLVVLGVVAFVALRPAPKEPAAPVKAVAESKPVSAPTTAAAPALGEKSIAVLPFTNAGGGKENEEFSDGVHDEVITNLSKIRDLTVINRNSVLAFRETAARNARDIAAKLGVATVLEGSVRRSGSKVRMNVQLINTRTEANVWADSFEGDASDIFALQASLAQKIATALKATLTASERSLIERRPTENPEAYGLYLRAKALEDVLTPRSGLAKYEESAALYAMAIERDPSFALAHARLTYLHSIMYWFGDMDPSPARRARAEAARAAAERLAPNAPETRIARGTIAYFIDNQWERSLVDYGAAEAALPNDARLQSLIAFAHRRLGHWAETVAHLERGLELNPSDFYTGTQLLAFLVDLRRFDAALDLSRRMQALAPGDAYVQNMVARLRFGLSGDRTAFVEMIKQLPAFDDDPKGLRAAYRLASLVEDWEAADRSLADPRLASVAGQGGILAEPPALHRAMVARLRGQTAEAQRFADEVVAWHRQRSFVPRQQPYAALCVARAQAFAGRAEVALPELKANLERIRQIDAYGAMSMVLETGRAYLALGRRDEAFAFLREMVSGPCAASPHELRIDPFWRQLKDDPRFEELLRQAKPL